MQRRNFINISIGATITGTAAINGLWYFTVELSGTFVVFEYIFAYIEQ